MRSDEGYFGAFLLDVYKVLASEKTTTKLRVNPSDRISRSITGAANTSLITILLFKRIGMFDITVVIRSNSLHDFGNVFFRKY